MKEIVQYNVKVEKLAGNYNMGIFAQPRKKSNNF